MEVYDLWENYHLNNFHAGTKAQEDLLKEAVKNRELNTYGANNYKETCAYLESKDMLYDKDYLVSKTKGWEYNKSPLSIWNRLVKRRNTRRRFIKNKIINNRRNSL